MGRGGGGRGKQGGEGRVRGEMGGKGRCYGLVFSLQLRFSTSDIHAHPHPPPPPPPSLSNSTHSPAPVVYGISKARSVHHCQPQLHSLLLNVNSGGIDAHCLLYTLYTV